MELNYWIYLCFAIYFFNELFKLMTMFDRRLIFKVLLCKKKILQKFYC